MKERIEKIWTKITFIFYILSGAVDFLSLGYITKMHHIFPENNYFNQKNSSKNFRNKEVFYYKFIPESRWYYVKEVIFSFSQSFSKHNRKLLILTDTLYKSENNK